jgi:hypothetical protein
MEKMDKMMRYEFLDVDDKVLFTFSLPDFHTDKKQKKRKFKKRNTWVATVATNFKFAYDEREENISIDQERELTGCEQIADCLGECFTLRLGER